MGNFDGNQPQAQPVRSFWPIYPTVCQHRGTPPMIDTHTAPAEKPANLTALQLQLADLAARSQQADRPAQDRSQETRGPIIVIRGK